MNEHDLRDTEPVVILSNGKGQHVAVPQSVAEGIRWSHRKYLLIKSGKTADEAEAIIRAEMAAELE